MKKMTFVAAMRDYFNVPARTPGQFLQELKALTDEDKAWFRQALTTVGYEIVSV